MEVPKLDFFWKYVEYWSVIDPNFPSIKYRKKIISAKEFNEKTDHLAKAFLEMGVNKGDTVVTVLPTIPEFIFSYIAASKIGAITIPMDKEYKKADFQLLIPHSAPKVIVTVDKWQKNKIADNLMALIDEFADIQYIMVGKHDLGVKFEEIMANEYGNDIELNQVKINQDPDDCILVIWTGGTTGIPKAVELTHNNVVEMCYLEVQTIGNWMKYLSGEDYYRASFLVNLPVSHVGGTVELLGSGILGGNEMILQASWSPWDALKAMKEFNIKFMGGVPTMFKILLSLPDLDTYDPKNYLKLIVLSGEKVSLNLLEGISNRICNNIVIGYGSTEAGAEVTFTQPGDNFEKIAQGYVGKPLPGMNIKIINEEGKILPAEEQGEVIISGLLTSKSYFRMPDEDIAGFTSDGYCKTGDLGYLDETGGLYISGRLKHIIRVGAYTVLPSEIEDLVISHPKVAIAAALGAPDEIKGEVVWLVIGPELGQKFDESDKEEILKKCRDNFAKFKVPEKIIIYPLDPNDLPITRIGKVDRVRLKRELIPPPK